MHGYYGVPMPSGQRNGLRSEASWPQGPGGSAARAVRCRPRPAGRAGAGEPRRWEGLGFEALRQRIGGLRWSTVIGNGLQSFGRG